MRKFSALVFIFSIPFCLSSQDYIPTVVEGKRWQLGYTDVNGQSFTIYYQIACDTFFNGHEYKSIIFESDYSILGFVREDTLNQSVYYTQDPFSNEILVADYLLEVGDTFYLQGSPIEVQAVYFESLFGENRKVVFFGQFFQFIEGVANSIWGVLDEQIPGYSHLVHGIELTGNTCESITSSSEPVHDRVRVFPNPFTDEVNLVSDDLVFQQQYVEIYNLMGERIYHLEFNNNRISTSQFIPGVYLFRVGMNSFVMVKN